MPEWYENDEFWRQISRLLQDETWTGNSAEQAAGIGSLLQLPEGARILDLGCGVGRHSVALAHNGFRVTGLDRTSPYLETARSKAAEAGVEIEWVHSDMRSFVRPAGFDAAISMLSSFGYFKDSADDRKVLDNLHTSLESGGRLLIDLMGKEVVARIFQARDWHEFDDGAFLIEERKPVDAWSRLEGRWIFIDGAERKEFHTDLRMFSAAEAADLLREAGFTEVAVYGGLDGSPYDQTAKRLVVTARK